MDTDARKKARQKYRDTHHLESVRLELPAGLRSVWKARAASQGKSLTAYITDLVDADIKKSKSSD